MVRAGHHQRLADDAVAHGAASGSRALPRRLSRRQLQRRHDLQGAGASAPPLLRRLNAPRPIAQEDRMTARLDAAQLAALAKYDTPTICNALSALAPDGGRTNVTSEMLHCPFPALGPMAGYAKTVTVRS